MAPLLSLLCMAVLTGLVVTWMVKGALSAILFLGGVGFAALAIYLLHQIVRTGIQEGAGALKERWQGARIRDLWGGWAIFGAMAVIGLALLFGGEWPWAFMLFGSAGFFFVSNFYEVRTPERALLFQFGECSKELRAGWYITLWPIHHIESETTSLQTLKGGAREEEKHTLYYKDGDDEIPITVYMRVFFKLTDAARALEHYGGLNTETSRQDIDSTSAAALRTALSKRSFAELLRAKAEIQKDIHNLVNAAAENGGIGGFGYAVTSVDIYDYDETTRSEAGQIRVLGKARGEAEGVRTTAVAGALMDNYPAALAVSVSNLATTVESVAKEWLGTKKTHRKGPEKPAEGTATTIVGISSATRATRQLAKEGEK